MKFEDCENSNCKWAYFKSIFSSLDPFTPRSNKERISPYNINAFSSRIVMRRKKILKLGTLVWFMHRSILSFKPPPPHWGEIEPCLTGVGKLDQKCQVFPAVEVFNPFAPMISIQILLSVFYAFLMIVAVRIWF